MGEFTFPKNRKAAEATLHEQVCKLHEEALEVVEAELEFEPDERILEETFDVIHACEGILRKYTKEQRDKARETVRAKCKRRGDYA